MFIMNIIYLKFNHILQIRWQSFKTMCSNYENAPIDSCKPLVQLRHLKILDKKMKKNLWRFCVTFLWRFSCLVFSVWDKINEQKICFLFHLSLNFFFTKITFCILSVTFTRISLQFSPGICCNRRGNCGRIFVQHFLKLLEAKNAITVLVELGEYGLDLWKKLSNNDNFYNFEIMMILIIWYRFPSLFVEVKSQTQMLGLKVC